MFPSLTPLIAAIPILLALIMLVALGWPAVRAMPVCSAVTAVLAIAAWGVAPVRVFAASCEGVVITFTILVILFGALLLAEQLKRAGALARVEFWLAARSPDRRIQVLLVAWLMGSFFEGAAGFGTPAAITAPLLVALGFPALLSVALALVGDSVAVLFGAVGTPLLVGIDQAVPGAPLGEVAWSQRVALQATLYDCAVGSLMPVLLVLTLTMGTNGRSGLRPGLQVAPFALLMGLAHTSTTALTAYLLGPELPSLLGPVAGLVVSLGLLRTGILVPSIPWRFPDDLAPGSAQTRASAAWPSLLASVTPYLLLVAVLVLTRLRSLGLGGVLHAASINFHDIFGTGLRTSFAPLHSPGTLFVLVALMTPRLFRTAWKNLADSARYSLAITGRAALSLVFAVVTVRIFIHSDVNSQGLAAMPVVLSHVAQQSVGGVWPLLAPWVGALGAFIAGSATFSNMLFAPVQHAVALSQELDVVKVLALQAMGAASGNMVCIHNVVAATAVVQLSGVEGRVIRKTLPPMVAYLVLAGVLGLVTM